MFAQAFSDYQPPQQSRGQDMSAQPNAQQHVAIPTSVGLAMAFIQQSCFAKGPRGFTKFEGCEQYDEVIEVELLGKHEAAFNQACNLMGTFFDTEAAQIRRRGALDEALFIKDHGVLLDEMFGGDDLGLDEGDGLDEDDPEKIDMVSLNEPSPEGGVRGYD